jgi:hypothetical protein
MSAIHPLMWAVSIPFLIFFAQEWLQGFIPAA